MIAGRARPVLCAAAVTLFAAVAAHADTPTVIGWRERVTLQLPGVTTPSVGGPVLVATIDTGAATSSLDARDMAAFSKDGSPWVRFSVVDTTGTVWPVTAQVVRRVRIRRTGTSQQDRVVVRLGLCVAGRTDVAEFTLADRRGQDAAVLVGRAFLAGRFLVDATATDTANSACTR